MVHVHVVLRTGKVMDLQHLGFVAICMKTSLRVSWPELINICPPIWLYPSTLKIMIRNVRDLWPLKLRVKSSSSICGSWFRSTWIPDSEARTCGFQWAVKCVEFWLNNKACRRIAWYRAGWWVERVYRTQRTLKAQAGPWKDKKKGPWGHE